MIDLYFTITPQNFLHRTDSSLIQNQIDEEYMCHFTFEGEDWQDKEKFVTFSTKNKKYTATVPTLAMAGTVGPIQVFQYWVQATEEEIEAAKAKNPAKN